MCIRDRVSTQSTGRPSAGSRLRWRSLATCWPSTWSDTRAFGDHAALLRHAAVDGVHTALTAADVAYLLGRLRVFGAALLGGERLLERALARFCEWFGAVLTMLRFQRPVAPLFATGLLFGFLSRDAAERVVCGQPRGTAVLRFAERHSSHFALTYVGGADARRVRHYLLTDADMVRGVADFVLRKPHFSSLLRYAGVDAAEQAAAERADADADADADDDVEPCLVQRLDKGDALHFCAERSSAASALPVFEGYEGLD
eukprot:TRINITY_DN48_c0_g3_i10.p2 TRINITY_DN48_c0_g3~~TRINITY_DN48_c0_g3_i10.p2  ORF type:complete len:258 (+),score=184.23 TRINITY_DN48_c0_g3_i10:165-938(+)